MATNGQRPKQRAVQVRTPREDPQQRVVLNVEVKRSTRNGLNRLKGLLGLPNQGAVLAELVRIGLAANKGR